jgi:signal transduction histidine kinase
VGIVIRDTGIGIPEEALPHIFEPFFTTKESGKGTGLGLAVVYGIVERHNGKITVQSKPTSGTVFTMVFPKGSVPPTPES